MTDMQSNFFSRSYWLFKSQLFLEGAASLYFTVYQTDFFARLISEKSILVSPFQCLVVFEKSFLAKGLIDNWKIISATVTVQIWIQAIFLVLLIANLFYSYRNENVVRDAVHPLSFGVLRSWRDFAAPIAVLAFASYFNFEVVLGLRSLEVGGVVSNSILSANFLGIIFYIFLFPISNLVVGLVAYLIVFPLLGRETKSSALHRLNITRPKPKVWRRKEK